MLTSVATSCGVSLRSTPPLPTYGPSVPSRMHSMSIAPGSASGLATPSNSLAGRRLTWWSSSKRSRSSSPRSRMPGGTLGSPIAPSRIASCPRSSSTTVSGSSSPVRCQRIAPRSYSVVSTSGATSRRTLRPSATTSGPIPSPAITARRMGKDPRSDGAEVGGPGLARADPAGDVVEEFWLHLPVDGDCHERLAAARGAADLRTGDVHTGLAQRGTDGAHDTRSVGVGEEEQIPGELQVDVEAVDLGQLGHLVLAEQRAGDGDLGAVGHGPAHRDQVPVVGALDVAGERDLEAALLGQQGRVHIGHLLLDDVGEDALEDGELHDLDVELRDLAAHVDGHRRRQTPVESGEHPSQLLRQWKARTDVLDDD